MNEKDTERLEDLKLRVFGLHAKGVMSTSRKDSPEILSVSKIESHNGRKNKAIRLLEKSGYIERTSRPESVTSSYTYGPYYKVLKFEEESEAYGSITEFRSTWEELIHDCKKDCDSVEKFENTGFICLKDLSHAANIYLYHNQDDFLKAKISKNHPLNLKCVDDAVYPISLEKDRIKAILRSCVEIYFLHKYRSLIEKKLDLPEGLISNNYDFSLGTISTNQNFFGLYPESLQKHNFEGSGSFLKEYTHYANYYAQMKNLVKIIIERVNLLGGYDKVRREMRQEIIETLMLEAPLFVTRDLNKTCNALEQHRVVSSKFFLKHSDLMTYDILYGDDESIKHYNDISYSYHNNRITETAFEPFEADEDEVKFLKLMKGVRDKCFAKMISKTLAHS